MRILRPYLFGIVLCAFMAGGASLLLDGADIRDAKNEKKAPVVPPPADWLDTTPVRSARYPLLLKRHGFTYQCMECHKDFKTPAQSVSRTFGEHHTIVFDHGINLNCLSCHHPDNRNAYMDHDYSEIPADKVVLLCRKCHGPVYRNWTAGVHGRLNGYWDSTRGSQTKLSCNQCHDPHQPHFPRLVPLPPPAVVQYHDPQEGMHHVSSGR